MTAKPEFVKQNKKYQMVMIFMCSLNGLIIVAMLFIGLGYFIGLIKEDIKQNKLDRIIYKDIKRG